MSRGAQTLKKGHVIKAIKGAMEAGLNVQRFEVDQDGKIIVFAGQPDATGEQQVNEWDSV